MIDLSQNSCKATLANMDSYPERAYDQTGSIFTHQWGAFFTSGISYSNVQEKPTEKGGLTHKKLCEHENAKRM